MRSSIALFVVVAGLLSAAACGGEAKPAESPAGAGSSAASASPQDSATPADPMGASPKGAEPESGPKP